MSPLAVLHADRKTAITRGVRFMKAEVAARTRGVDRVALVALGSSERLRAPIVVNTAGRWASKIAWIVG